MKKIINGRKYDTDTAHYVGHWDNGEEYGDFGYEEAKLYRKRNGEHFLALYGGANTRYAKSDGTGSWSGGSMIQPVSFEDAREWAERHLKVEDYEAEFGEAPGGDEDLVAVTVRITEGARQKLQRESSRTGKTQSAIVESMLLGL